MLCYICKWRDMQSNNPGINRKFLTNCKTERRERWIENTREPNGMIIMEAYILSPLSLKIDAIISVR